MRFTTAELEQIRGTAKQDGLAIGAWIGQAALRIACRRSASAQPPVHRYPNWMVGELLRIRVDVDVLGRTAPADPTAESQALVAVRRLDALIDAVVAGLP